MPALLAFGCAEVLGFERGEPGAELARGGARHGEDAQMSGAPITEPTSGATGDASSGAPQGGESQDSPTGLCGNDQVDGAEECDGDKLAGATCASLADGAGGSLRCQDCEYDLSDCYHVRSIDVSEHACVVLTNDKIKCWGLNSHGQLGLGDNESRGEEAGEMGEMLLFVELGPRRVLQVATGYHHTCALVQSNEPEGNEVVCWGSNLYGQLGQLGGDALAPAIDGRVELGEGTVVQVAAGGAHTCALFETGQVKCWGNNQYGQLGLGHVQPRGKAVGEMGDKLPFVDLGSDGAGNPLKVEAITAGENHTCARMEYGQVKCWGNNWQGLLGISSFEENRGEAGNEMGNSLPAVDLGAVSAVQLSAGAQHNCVFGTAYTKCWGYNGDGQLGTGEDGSRGSLPDKMGNALPGIELGELYPAGITAGYSHTCAWSRFDGVKCWGSNTGGELGLGDIQSRGNLPEQMGQALPFVDLGTGQAVMSVRAGYKVTCAILEPGRVKCWGFNVAGNLGAGHERSVGRFPGEMGDALPFVEL